MVRLSAPAFAAFALALAHAPARGQVPALNGEVLRTYQAAEANQGVAVDDRYFYAVDNSRIGRYDKATGEKIDAWSGDPKVFPHLNSCTSVGAELVCASSNYPATPMTSTAEVFDRASLTHLRSIKLGRQIGSLTWLVRRGDFWWAGFANYDGKGGEPGRDHTFSAVVKFDDTWRSVRHWRFPDAVLDRFAPMSTSGGVLGANDLLYVSGHDNPEVYVMRAPEAGDTLELVATVAVPIEGQAIAFDPSSPRILFGINRKARQVVAVKLPETLSGLGAAADQANNN